MTKNDRQHFWPEVYDILKKGTKEIQLRKVPDKYQPVDVRVNGLPHVEGVDFTIEGSVLKWSERGYILEVGDAVTVSIHPRFER